ncbi:hypothetical protein MHYP_G00216810 [Metynnis hypsauchen]
MKRKASEGGDDQTLTQTLPIKKARTDGKEVNFSTLTFPQKLWHIVENETYNSIGWHQWGTCIVIDVELFSAEILSQQGELKIFETSIMKSFKQQLNLHGFKKIRSLDGRLKSTCMDQVESTSKKEVYHSGYFRREHPELLMHVKRRLQVKAKRNSGSKPMTLAWTSQSQTPQSGLIEEATPSASKTSMDLGFSQDTSTRYNSIVNFHSFPVDEEVRKKWLVNIKRDNFQITKHTRVCSVHFTGNEFVEGTQRRRLKRSAVPTLFQWNQYGQVEPRRGVWERRERPEPHDMDIDEASMEHGFEMTCHDYCSFPEAAALDLALINNEELTKEVEDLRNKLEQIKLQNRSGLQRFAASDEDIRFYTR